MTDECRHTNIMRGTFHDKSDVVVWVCADCGQAFFPIAGDLAEHVKLTWQSYKRFGVKIESTPPPAQPLPTHDPATCVICAACLRQSERIKADADAQPPPVHTESSGPEVWPLVIGRMGPADVAADMLARDAFGRTKYGVPLRVALVLVLLGVVVALSMHKGWLN